MAVVALAAAAGLAHTGRHHVNRGETLSHLAKRYGTSVDALVEANGIADRDLIIAGSTLVLPGGGAATGGGGRGVVHTVAAGETLLGLALRYGTTVSAITEANGIADRHFVRIGQRLEIPAGGGSGGRTGSPASPPPAPAGSHVVGPGDTLASIASRYGVSVEALAAANGIVQPFTVYSGTRLHFGGAPSLPALARCPVPGASFFNDWGFPRSGGRYHEGNDLFAPRGTPVLAPAAGEVAHATGAIGGLQFRLWGDDGVLYIGTHMDAFGASGRVGPGDVIGYVGDSGNARGGRPHLHFELHPGGGRAVNPYPTVVAACR